ncbi:TonB-dependent receptor plug domain-containing protein [Vibrio sp.]|nr:TonB-dependent receptor plug domain-containing protein [Vibrio sp.]
MQVQTLPFAVSLLSLSIFNTFADDGTNSETVTVSATRYSQDIDKIPGAVSVISEESLNEQRIISDDLTSVIATMVPSMTPSRQKLSNQGENLRGRTALIMVDGVPQNNPLRNGNRYGYTIDPSMIERIEVIAGASAVQGMGATGGIINYVTKGAKHGDDWKQTVGTRYTSALKNDSDGSKVYYSVSEFENDYDLFLSGAWQQQGLYYDGEGNPIGMNAVQGETQDSTATDVFMKTGYNFGDHQEQRLEFMVNTYELESNDNYTAVNGDFENGIPGTVEKGSPDSDSITNEVQLYSMKYSHNNLNDGLFSAHLFYQNYDAVYGEAN